MKPAKVYLNVLARRNLSSSPHDRFSYQHYSFSSTYTVRRASWWLHPAWCTHHGWWVSPGRPGQQFRHWFRWPRETICSSEEEI